MDAKESKDRLKQRLSRLKDSLNQVRDCVYNSLNQTTDKLKPSIYKQR